MGKNGERTNLCNLGGEPDPYRCISHRDRRTALGLFLAAPLAGLGLVGPDAACAAALTREERDSCIDSRAPAEIILDAGIGDTFNARIAGNIANDDLIGSLEFACAAAGAKVVLVMGHTACGAVKGAIDAVELGHLTALLDKIKPAVAATTYSGARTSKNDAFVDAVAATNVRRTVDDIRARSTVLTALEKDGKIKIVASMYHLVGGRVEFLT